MKSTGNRLPAIELLSRFAAIVGEKYAVIDPAVLAPFLVEGRGLYKERSAMLDSPRRPSRTMRIFSSGEYCLRVARRMFFTIRSDGDSECTDFCLISTP